MKESQLKSSSDTQEKAGTVQNAKIYMRDVVGLKETNSSADYSGDSKSDEQ